MDKLQFKLNDFEGPLDLLLYLIRKNKMDICAVEISELLKQYLDFINQMQAESLEISSGFLEMTARLIYIKTCSLLPCPEEEEVLRAELTGELLQLDIVKRVASLLQERCCIGRVFTKEPSFVPLVQAYDWHHDPEELCKAYALLQDKAKRREPPSPEAFEGIVRRRVVSISSRVVYILRKLYIMGKVSYYEFFQSAERSEMIATFLAMLELVKSKRIHFSIDNRYVIFNKGQALIEQEEEDG